MSAKTCPSGHTLFKTAAPQDVLLRCDDCSSRILGGAWAYSCPECDHDLCGPCVGEKRTPQGSQEAQREAPNVVVEKPTCHSSSASSLRAFNTPAATSFSVGARVKARFRATTIGAAGTKWFEGTVMACHADGTCDITYVDGDVEHRVQPRFIKPTVPAPEFGQARASPAAAPVAARETRDAMDVDESWSNQSGTAQVTGTPSISASAQVADAPSVTTSRAGMVLDGTQPKDTWVQCDDCNKWRRIVCGSGDELPDKWVCALSTDPLRSSCEVEEESEPEEEGLEAGASSGGAGKGLPEDWGIIEALVKSRGKHKAQRQYLVKWQGYPHSSNSWERGSTLPKAIVDAYERESSAVSAAAPAGGQTVTSTSASSAAPAPAPAPSRSGKRKIVPTMVKVGREYVKRQNLYDMETGERSIFDSEYDGRRDAAFAPVDRAAHSVSATSTAKSAPKAAAKAPAAREVSAAEKRRVANNDAIRADAAVLAERRAHFFAAHAETIAPFVEPSVLRSVQATANAAGTPPARRALLSQPESVSGGEMRDYQLVGLDWLVDSYERHGLCPILGDEMGLGKTLQTIAFLAYLKHELKAEGASLVVCPLSVLSTWTSELGRWCPSLRTVKLHSSDPAERERLKDVVLNQIGSYDVVVTTYEMVKSPLLRTALVQKVHWRMLVLDEGHIIKSVETDISATVRKMHFASALLLTGTPLQNNLTELWALLNFLYPDVFTTSDVFDAGFNISDGVADAETMNAAHHVLQLLMLRRLKESVAAEMPPKLETLVTCPLADAQLFWYRRLLLKDSSVLRTVEANGTDSLGDGDAPAPTAKYKTLMNLLMQVLDHGPNSGALPQSLALPCSEGPHFTRVCPAAQVLRPPLPLRGRGGRPGRDVARGARGRVGQAARARPPPRQAHQAAAPRRPLLPVRVDGGPARRLLPAAPVQLPAPDGLDEPRAADGQPAGLQRARLEGIPLPHDNTRRRSWDQPPDGRHGHPLRLGLEPAV